MKLTIRPTNFRDANAFIHKYHRHAYPVKAGFKFAICVVDENEKVRGVAIAGNPIARMLDDGLTIEIRRNCTDGTPNACSMLYGACCRAAKAMGFRLAVTYTLQSENGTSLKASGFTPIAYVVERQWTSPSRFRLERDLIGDKIRWEKKL